MDLLDYLVEASRELGRDVGKRLVTVTGPHLDVPAEGGKFVAQAVDQLLGNPSCAKVGPQALVVALRAKQILLVVGVSVPPPTHDLGELVARLVAGGSSPRPLSLPASQVRTGEGTDQGRDAGAEQVEKKIHALQNQGWGSGSVTRGDDSGVETCGGGLVLGPGSSPCPLC